MSAARPSVEEATWGMFGRCVACRKHPALGPPGYCGTCYWELVIEVANGWTLFSDLLSDAVSEDRQT